MKLDIRRNRQALVVMMLATLTHIFSELANARAAELRPRQADLSGNVFHFSIPENFSRDMPAYEMTEKLDVYDLENFDDPEYGNLIRRWWDVKEPGWFGKNLGTVMMDISVQRAPENKAGQIHGQPYEIRDRLDFMLMVDESLHRRYDALNSEMSPTSDGLPSYYWSFATMVGNRLVASQREFVFSEQKWIQYSVLAPRNDLIYSLAVPLTDKLYIEAAFTYSANDNSNIREFRDAAIAKMAPIQESFRVQYAEGNPMAQIVGGDWLSGTNDEILEGHRHEVLKLFPEPDRDAILPGEALSAKSIDGPQSGPL